MFYGAHLQDGMSRRAMVGPAQDFVSMIVLIFLVLVDQPSMYRLVLSYSYPVILVALRDESIHLLLD